MKLRALGQIEVPAAVVTAVVALATSALTGVTTYTLAEARATAAYRATVESHSYELERLRGLPVADLKALPARFEVLVSAAEAQAKSVEELKVLMMARYQIRSAKGQR